jgi:hypothetical protein
VYLGKQLLEKKAGIELGGIEWFGRDSAGSGLIAVVSCGSALMKLRFQSKLGSS